MSKNLNANVNKAIILGQAKEIVSLCEKNKILTEALQNIEKEIPQLGIQMIDTQNPMQMALYTCYHFANKALKQTS